MSNFGFLQAEWQGLHEAAAKAESLVNGDARASCFYARRSLEITVSWLYKNDRALRLPEALPRLRARPALAQPRVETFRQGLEELRRQGQGQDQGAPPPDPHARGRDRPRYQRVPQDRAHSAEGERETRQAKKEMVEANLRLVISIAK